MDVTILACLLDCGLLVLFLTIERRIARMETKMGLCRSCPITSDNGDHKL